MKKRIRIIIPIAIVLAATVVWLVLRNGRTANAPLMASGTVEATQADLGFEVPGRILEITAREGDSVSAGAELARLDTRQLRAGLEGLALNSRPPRPVLPNWSAARAPRSWPRPKRAYGRPPSRPRRRHRRRSAPGRCSTEARSVGRLWTARKRRNRSPPPRSSRLGSSWRSCAPERASRPSRRNAP